MHVLPILIWVLLSVLVGLLGREREFGFWGFFLASVFFSPVVTALVLVLTAVARPRS